MILIDFVCICCDCWVCWMGWFIIGVVIIEIFCLVLGIGVGVGIIINDVIWLGIVGGDIMVLICVVGVIVRIGLIWELFVGCVIWSRLLFKIFLIVWLDGNGFLLLFVVFVGDVVKVIIGVVWLTYFVWKVKYILLNIEFVLIKIINVF